MAQSKSTLAARMTPQPAGKKPTGKAKAPSGIDAFIGNMLAHHDVAEATQIVAQHAEHVWDAEYYGWEAEQISRKIAALDEDYKRSEANVKALKKVLDDTPTHVKKSASKNPDNENGEPKPTKWDTADKIKFAMGTLALAAVICMGMANVFSTLISAGIAVFIDKPYLAVAISALLPTASLSIKGLTHFIHNQAYRRRYGLAIYMLTLLLLIIWMILFARTYQGNGSGLDINALLEDSSASSTWLVWAQLMLEMLIGSSLFLTLEEIASHYSDDFYAPNMAHYEAEKAYEAALASHEKLADDYAGRHGRLVQLHAEQQRFIDEHVAAFVAQYNRRAAQFN